MVAESRPLEKDVFAFPLSDMRLMEEILAEVMDTLVSILGPS